MSPVKFHLAEILPTWDPLCDPRCGCDRPDESRSRSPRRCQWPRFGRIHRPLAGSPGLSIYGMRHVDLRCWICGTLWKSKSSYRSLSPANVWCPIILSEICWKLNGSGTGALPTWLFRLEAAKRRGKQGSIRLWSRFRDQGDSGASRVFATEIQIGPSVLPWVRDLGWGKKGWGSRGEGWGRGSLTACFWRTKRQIHNNSDNVVGHGQTKYSLFISILKSHSGKLPFSALSSLFLSFWSCWDFMVFGLVGGLDGRHVVERWRVGWQKGKVLANSVRILLSTAVWLW